MADNNNFIKCKIKDIILEQNSAVKFTVIDGENLLCETANAREAILRFSETVEQRIRDSLLDKAEEQGFNRYTGRMNFK